MDQSAKDNVDFVMYHSAKDNVDYVRYTSAEDNVDFLGIRVLGIM